MSDSVTTPPTAQKPRRTLTRAVIRFAGDSGDGMQVTGEQFTTEAAWAGNAAGTSWTAIGRRNMNPRRPSTLGFLELAN